jgi:Ser-tRNA(Ala) deacylase AlaX
VTDFLFRDDAYLARCEATVTAAGPQGVELDRTVFYATSGGQPGGRLGLAGGASLRVVRRGSSCSAVRTPTTTAPDPLPSPGMPGIEAG